MQPITRRDFIKAAGLGAALAAAPRELAAQAGDPGPPQHPLDHQRGQRALSRLLRRPAGHDAQPRPPRPRGRALRRTPSPTPRSAPRRAPRSSPACTPQPGHAAHAQRATAMPRLRPVSSRSTCARRATTAPTTPRRTTTPASPRTVWDESSRQGALREAQARPALLRRLQHHRVTTRASIHERAGTSSRHDPGQDAPAALPSRHARGPARLGAVLRQGDGDGRRGRGAARRNWTRTGWPTTRSSSTTPTTAASAAQQALASTTRACTCR